MKGISSIIVMILLLLIGVSLTGLGYVTFTSLFSQITQTTESTISQTTTMMLAQVKIESIVKSICPAVGATVNVRNIGKVDVTQIRVYINDRLDNAILATLTPGQVGTITTATYCITTNDVVKVTTAQGAIAIQTAP